MAGVHELIRRAGRRYCMATSTSIDARHDGAEVIGLHPLFRDRIFCASMVANGKPAPDLFLHAARDPRRRPGETPGYRGQRGGVQAAENAGMEVWRFVGGSHFDANEAALLATRAGPANLSQHGRVGEGAPSRTRLGRKLSLAGKYSWQTISADQDQARGGEADIRLDDAARAGWLYYVAGNTQDEIAQKLGVSRQTAQRLVAMSVSEKLDQGAPRPSDRSLHGARRAAEGPVRAGALRSRAERPRLRPPAISASPRRRRRTWSSG